MQKLCDLERHGPLPIRHPQQRRPGDGQALLAQGKSDQPAIIQISLHGPFAEYGQSLAAAGCGRRRLGPLNDDIAIRPRMGRLQEFQIFETGSSGQAVGIVILRRDVLGADVATFGEPMRGRHKCDQLVGVQLDA